MLAYRRRLHDSAVVACAGLELRQQTAANRAVVLMYGNIVELSGAFLQLAETSHWVGTKTIARACLEASVSLQNLLDDDDYLKTLEAVSLHGLARRFRNACDEGNDFYRDIRAIPNRAQPQQEVAARLQVLQDEGFPHKSIFQMFEQANMADVYRSVYGVLSNEAHSGIDTLYARHLGVDRVLEFEVYRDVDPADRYPEIDLVASILAVAHNNIHDRLNLPGANDAEALLNEFHELRRQNGFG